MPKPPVSRHSGAPVGKGGSPGNAAAIFGKSRNLAPLLSVEQSPDVPTSIFGVELPREWKRVPIATHYRITKKPKELKPQADRSLPFIPMEAVPTNGQMVCKFELRKLAEIKSGIYFESGDILLSKITPSFENGKQGMACGLPEKFGYGSTEIIPLQAITTEASNIYLFYLLLQHEIRELLTGKMEGSTGRKRVPESAIRNLEIPLPPKPEQEKIAAVLWKVQRAIATQDRLIAATRDLKASAMQRLFTHGLHNEPLKDTEIGPVPEGWELEILGNIAETTSGGTPNRSETKYYNGNILWVKSGELNDGYIEDTEEKITTEGLRHSSAKLFQPGTLLIAMYGATVGKTAILEVAAATNQAVCAIFTSPEKVDSEFLRYSLIYDRPELLSRRYGGAQPNISQTVIRNFTIRCPSLEEQRAIAAALATLDRKLAYHRKKRAALNDLFQTLLHKLMTAKIRVNRLDIDTSEIVQSLIQGVAT